MVATNAAVTCVGALLVRDQRVLMGLRAKHKSFADCWDIIGGHVEPGESAEDALARELREELGVTPLQWSLLGSLFFAAAPAPTELLIYSIRSWHGVPRCANDEHSALRWFRLEEAAQLENLAFAQLKAFLEVAAAT